MRKRGVYLITMKHKPKPKLSSSEDDSSSDCELKEVATTLSESIKRHILKKRREQSSHTNNSIFVLDKTPGGSVLESPAACNEDEKVNWKPSEKGSKEKSKKKKNQFVFSFTFIITLYILKLLITLFNRA